jgi:hypothetical protein
MNHIRRCGQSKLSGSIRVRIQGPCEHDVTAHWLYQFGFSLICMVGFQHMDWATMVFDSKCGLLTICSLIKVCNNTLMTAVDTDSSLVLCFEIESQ